MKIAIFGDSFAVNEVKNGRIKAEKRIKNGFSYTNELEKKYDIENFAQSGTGLYWSYDKYLKFAKNFDKIIFIASHNNRITLKHNSKNYIPLNWSPSLASPRIKALSKHFYNTNDVPYSFDKANKHITWFYRYIFDQDQANQISKLIVQDLEKDPQTLVIPAFQCSYKIKDEVFIKNYHCSTSFAEILEKLEDPYYKVDFSKGYDLKFCHFSDENNKILFEKIKKWIETNQFTLDVDDFVEPSDNAKKYLP